MKLSDVMGAMRLATYAEVALVIFFVVFLLVVAQLVLRRSARWEHVSRLPLDDSDRCDCDAQSRGANDA